MITVSKFGQTKDGREVLCFTLADGECSVKILNYGGIIQSLIVPDKNGVPTDVVLGYNEVTAYEDNDGYLGALIGRFGNRIHRGRLSIDGQAYSLYCNDKGNHLHGGKSGFNQKIWAHEIVGERLVLSTLSPDGEENYPGNLTVRVAYSLIGGELKIEYYALSDKKTAINLTNHSYFNLSGEGSGSVDDTLLWLDGDYITPTDGELIPHGEFKAVRGTPFDFNTPKPIGRDIEREDTDLLQGSGYDHCYLLKRPCGEYGKYAKAYSRKRAFR